MSGVARCLMLLAVMAVLACSGAELNTTGGALAPGVPPAADTGPSVATPRGEAVSAELGPSGGTLEAALPDGARFRFTLPPGALQDPVTVTLTPVELTGLGFPVAYSVQLTPEGTVFEVPAELALQPPAGAGPLFPFTFQKPGQPGTRLLPKTSGNEILVTVQHFSFFGWVIPETLESWTDSVIFNPNLPPPTEEAGLQNQLAQEALPDPTAIPSTDIFNLLNGHFVNSVLPSMEAGIASDDRLVVFGGLRRYLHFRQVVDFCAALGYAVSVEFFEQTARPKMVALLKRMVELEGRRMVRANNVDHIHKAIFWGSVAQQLNLDTPENGLDLPSIVKSLPIELVTRPDDEHGNGPHPDEEHFVFPAAQAGESQVVRFFIDEGDEEPLEIVCGYRLGDNPPMSDKAVRLRVTLEGGVPGSVSDLETNPSQRTTAGVVDGVVQVVPAPQFTGNSGLATVPGVRLADDSDGITMTVEASLLGVTKRFVRRYEGKLFMAALAGPAEMAMGSTAAVRVPLLRKGTKRLVGKKVDFRVTSGGGSLSPAEVFTDSQGAATVQYTAPQTGGEVTLEATCTDGPQTVTERLTILIRPPQLAASWSGSHSGFTTRFNNNPPVSSPGGAATLSMQFGNEFLDGQGRLVTGGTFQLRNQNGGTIRTIVITGGTFTYSSRRLRLNGRVDPPDAFSQGARIEATLSPDESQLTEGLYEEVVQTLINRIQFSAIFSMVRD